jgi:hypothetical protein
MAKITIIFFQLVSASYERDLAVKGPRRRAKPARP